MAALAGESQKIFMVTVTALYTGKTVVQVATVQIPVNNLQEIGSVESVLTFKSSVPMAKSTLRCYCKVFHKNFAHMEDCSILTPAELIGICHPINLRPSLRWGSLGWMLPSVC